MRSRQCNAAAVHVFVQLRCCFLCCSSSSSVQQSFFAGTADEVRRQIFCSFSHRLNNCPWVGLPATIDHRQLFDGSHFQLSLKSLYNFASLSFPETGEVGGRPKARCQQREVGGCTRRPDFIIRV